MFWLALSQDELENHPLAGRQTIAIPLCTMGIAVGRRWAAICRQRSGEVPPGRGGDVAAYPERPGPDEQEGVMAVERLLSVTAEADGKRCRLTAIVDAYRTGHTHADAQ